ncbi:MAG: FAD-binding oxidoreductase, partial [Oricola sp.]
GYDLEMRDGMRLRAARVIVAAGLGNAALAATLGKSFPVRPVRGQILVTRRLPHFLDLPTTHVRQTAEGSVLLGDSKEDVGVDYGTTLEIAAKIAARSVASFPALGAAPVVRSWGALRVMSPDGFPIYQTWPDLPGLWMLTCHSGVTLCAVHAGPLAAAIDGAGEPAEMSHFTMGRFDVSTARAV